MTPLFNVKKQDMNMLDPTLRTKLPRFIKQLYAVFNIQIYRQM